MHSRDALSREGQGLFTLTGKCLDPRAPVADQIDIQDIAHGLAYQCCFDGQVRHFYSIAQHALMVADQVPPRLRLAALLHDGAAAYFGNGAASCRLPDFALIEQRLLAAIAARFAITGFDAPNLRRAHQVVQATECRDLRPAELVNGQKWAAPLPRRIEFLSPEEARYQFLERFEQCMAQPPRAASSPAPDRAPERSPRSPRLPLSLHG